MWKENEYKKNAERGKLIRKKNKNAKKKMKEK